MCWSSLFWRLSFERLETFLFRAWLLQLDLGTRYFALTLRKCMILFLVYNSFCNNFLHGTWLEESIFSAVFAVQICFGNAPLLLAEKNSSLSLNPPPTGKVFKNSVQWIVSYLVCSVFYPSIDFSLLFL